MDKQKMGRSARRKGHDWEREVAAAIREAIPEIASQVRRGQQGDGAVFPDVWTPGFWIECKNAVKAPLRPAMRQAMSDLNEAAIDGLDPIAVVKGDARAFPPLVLMRFEDWLELYRRSIK